MGEGPAEGERPPVVFRVAVVAMILYLGVRLVQGVMWVVDRLG